MGEDAPSADLALGEVDQTREGGSAGAGEPDRRPRVILSLADSSGTGVALEANW